MNITLNIVAGTPGELQEAIAGLANLTGLKVNDFQPAQPHETPVPVQSAQPQYVPSVVQTPGSQAQPMTPVQGQLPSNNYPSQQPQQPQMQQTPVQQAPQQLPPTNAAVPTAAAPTYTMDQLAVAATQLMDAGRQAELVGLLGSFGVQALTQLPKEQYGNFATQLRTMGAKI